MSECDLFSNKDLKEWKDVDPDYMIIVQEAICSDKNLEIENSDMDHAKFLSYLLIKKARKQIKIFTGKLKDSFYSSPKIFTEFQRAIDRGVEVEIVLSDKPEKSKFLDLARKEKDHIKLFKLKDKNPINHFLICDETSYRLEAPHTDTDLVNNRVKGLVNFNDPDFAKKISFFFDNTLLKNTETI